MRSIIKFVFVSVPTAALATAVVVGVSRNGQSAAAVSDGDLQRDLRLASSTNLELAPAGQALATVSAIEAPPAASSERPLRPKRRASSSRTVRSRARTVRAAPEPEVAESAEESQGAPAAEVSELASVAEAIIEAPAEAGGVALPRPTAIPVSYPGAGAGTMDDDPRPVIRGGVIDGDHCRVGGRPVYRQPRGGWGGTLGDRVRAATGGATQSRPSSLGDRIRVVQGRSSGGQARGSSSRVSLGGRVRAAAGRR